MILVCGIAHAQAPTTTTLTVSPNMATAGQVVTLTATVTNGSQPVPVGTVIFLSGTQPLGVVQMRMSDGTATLKTRFAPGSDTLTAHYNGNNLFQTSTSTPQPLTVTGTEPTTSTLSAVPDGSNYDFTLNVFGFGFPAPTGTASLDETSQPIHLGDFSLAAPGVSSFLPQQTYPTNSGPWAVAIGDFNGDGFADLAVVDANSFTLSVLLGNGDGTFQTQQSYSTFRGPRGIVVADFNGDGNADLAITDQNDNTVSVLLGKGDGTFQQLPPFTVGMVPNGITVGDFNRDGIADLAVANAGDGTVGVLLGNGDGTFQPQQTYPVLANCLGIATGDFNGDGIADLAATGGGGMVSVLLGNGDGTFQGQQSYATGSLPFGVAVADFRGNGIADLAVINEADNTVSVLLGNGNGTFQAQQTYSVGTAPHGIAVADFNGDGIADLAVTNYNNNDVGVLLGNGDGTFKPQQTYAVGTNPVGIAIADLNGDGVPDIVTANLNQSNVGVLIAGTSTTAQLTNIAVLGQGTQTVQSTYAPNTQFYTGGKSNSLQLNGTQLVTMTMVTVDINPSQYLQQVTFTATVTAANNGSPTGTVNFSSDEQGALCNAVPLTQISGASVATCVVSLNIVGSHLITAAYSGDNNYAPGSGSLIQIVNPATTTTALGANPPNQQVFGQPVTLTATITGAFGGVPTGTVNFTESIHLINLCLGVQLVNGVASCQTSALPEGQDNIVATYGGDPNFVGSNMSLPYKIVAASSATSLSLNPPSPIVAGQVDTLTATVTSNSQPVTAGTVTFLSGTVVLGTVQIKKFDGTATLKTRFAPGSDTLTAQYNGTNSYGQSTSAPQPLLVTGAEPTTSTLSAVPNGSNYDFTLDVFGYGYPAPTGTASLDELQIPPIHLGGFTLAGPGAFTFQPPQTYATGTAPNGNGVGDFNGDGIVDLAVANFNDDTVGVLLGNGDGTFQLQKTYAAPSGPLSIAVADFNADGFADLAVTNQSNGQVSVLLGNGDGTFQPPQTYPVGFAPNGIAAADFNGDGIPDLVITNALDNTVSVLLGKGDGTFQPQQTYAVGHRSYGVAVADFNGDGIPDLAVTNADDNTVSVLLGNGDGTFQPQQTYATGAFPRLITSGDFNRDGVVDLAVTDQNDNTVSVLLGNGNGTFKPQVPYAVGSGPQGIAIADFNGDGFADLAITNSCAIIQCQSVGTVSILLGKGDGTFQPQQEYPTGGSAPLGIAVADFNGDGVPDVAANNQGSKDVSVLIAGASTTATLTNIPVLGQGTQTVQGTYSPNTQFYAGGKSNSLQLTGTQLATTTTLTADVNPSQYLQPVTFTATVTAPNNGSPTGTVSFTDTSQLLCNATLTTISGGSVATCVVSFNQLGNHMIVATYSADNNYLPSQGTLTQMVIRAVTSVSPQETPPNPVFGQLVTLTGTVTGAFGGAPTGTMDFTESNHQINLCLGVQLVNGIATCQTSALPLGAVKVFYSYSGDANFQANGAFLIFRVLGAVSATTLSVNPPSPIMAGQVETLTATVTSNNQPVPAGTVTFFSGTQPLGTVQVKQSSGAATAILKTRFAPGSDSLTAVYNGTNQIGVSTSAPQPLIVTGTEPTVSTLSATPNGSNYDFNLNVFGFGFTAPSGTASLDETSLPIHLGDFSLAAPGALAFQAPVTYQAGNYNSAIAAGDFNGDGIPDLAVSNTNDNTVSVFLGKGDGTFGAQITVPVDPAPFGIVAGDFNSDGNLDIAVAADNGGGIDILLGNGDGTFQPKQLYPFANASGLAVGDFNGDGFPDLVVINGNSVGVLLNSGNGTFSSGGTIQIGTFLQSPAVGDFNSDGNLDVAVLDYSGNDVIMLLGDGMGGFLGSPQTFPVGTKPFALAVGDLNQDGRLDLAVSNSSDNSVSILLGSGDGTFQPQQTYPVGQSPTGVAIADWNGDGIPDLAIANFSFNTVSILLGSGDGIFQPQQVFVAAKQPASLIALDLNGDGFPDLATPNETFNSIGVLLGGTSTLAQLSNVVVPGQGQVTVQSTYAPDAKAAIYAGSMSNIVTVTGNPNSTVTTLTADFNPSGITEAVTFRATVTGANGSPTGTVTFMVDGTNLCAAVPLQPLTNAGFATCMTSSLSFGDHTVVATYSGDSLYIPSTSTPLTETIQKISNYVVVLTVQAQNQGSSILLTASVEPRHCDLICIPPAQVVPTGTVTFGPSQQDLTSLGSAQLNSQAMASVTVTNPGALSAIYAQYLGDANFIPVISNPQDSVAPPLVVQSATTTAGSVLSVALNLTVDFPQGTNYFKQITCNAPIALGITCTPNPAIITSNSQANVDIKTSGGIAYLRTPGTLGGDVYRLLALATQLGLPAAVWLGFAATPRRRRKRIAGILLLLVACSPILITSCGGSFAPGTAPGGSSSATPPGTYFITGTATLYKKAASQAGGNLQIGTPQSFLIQLLVK